MAATILPPDWIADWSENGTNVTFPIASIPEMSADEADATTGDMRKVLFAICDQMYEVYNALATDNKPTKMTIYRSTSTNDLTGAVTKSYQFVFNVSVGSVEVVDE